MGHDTHAMRLKLHSELHLKNALEFVFFLNLNLIFVVNLSLNSSFSHFKQNTNGPSARDKYEVCVRIKLLSVCVDSSHN